jgi:hypothetical protein
MIITKIIVIIFFSGQLETRDTLERRVTDSYYGGGGGGGGPGLMQQMTVETSQMNSKCIDL